MTQNNEPNAKPEDAAKPESDQEEIEFLDSDALMAFLDESKSSPSAPDDMDFLEDTKPSPSEPDDDKADLFKTIELTEELQAAAASQIAPDPEATDPSALESDDAEAKVAEAEDEPEGAAFFDSGALLDELGGVTPSGPAPDLEATDPSAPAPDLEDTDPSALEPEPVEAEVSEAEDEHEETAFFDSSELLAELEGFKTAKPAPDLEATDPSALEPEPVEAEVSEAEEDDEDPDHEETAFFDSGSLLEELEGVKPSEPAPDQAEEEHDETVFLDSGSLADQVQAEEPAAPTEKTKIGNYEVVQMLGKGGFGSVWSAKASDGHPVAVKVLNPDVLENERAVRKFFHEAINLAKMNHPNICRFIDFFPHEGNYAIVMDFVQGIDLQDLLKSQKGPLPFDVARRVASQVLDGLHYAHQQDVLHRDIKPENITLTAEGAAKVMDFGIARLSSSEPQQTSLYMISPAYTAPERFDASKTDLVDHRSDIYSLGLVFYEIFTGKHPFPTDNPSEMIMAHLTKVPTSPDEIVDLPEQINDAILKAVEKDPEDRFQDFAEFKMEMLGEPPLISSQSIGPMEFFGEDCKNSANLLKTLSGLIKKHQKQAKKITVGQVGRR